MVIPNNKLFSTPLLGISSFIALIILIGIAVSIASILYINSVNIYKGLEPKMNRVELLLTCYNVTTDNSLSGYLCLINNPFNRSLQLTLYLLNGSKSIHILEPLKLNIIGCSKLNSTIFWKIYRDWYRCTLIRSRILFVEVEDPADEVQVYVNTVYKDFGIAG